MADHEHLLDTYAELIVKVGLNLREGQRLLIIGPLASGGVSLAAAPLVRHVAASAYRAGAPLVETIWGDEALQLTRFRDAPRQTFGEVSAWLPEALVQHARGAHAVLSVYANDPDQLKQEDPRLITALQQATARAFRPFREHITRNDINWSVAAAPAAACPRRVP